MALQTILHVGFKDAAGRINERQYRILDTDDDFGNIAAVLTARDAVETAIDALTWDHIEYIDMKFRKVGAGAAANVAANNQVYAFTRTNTADGLGSSFFINAWDDLTYSEDENGLLSGVYNTAALALALLLKDPETGSAMTEVKFSQSRGRKMRKKQIA